MLEIESPSVGYTMQSAKQWQNEKTEIRMCSLLE